MDGLRVLGAMLDQQPVPSRLDLFGDRRDRLQQLLHVQLLKGDL